MFNLIIVLDKIRSDTFYFRSHIVKNNISSDGLVQATCKINNKDNN